MKTICKQRVAPISNIQKFCMYDGPGIRDVVFFMGCPLRCKWCQNPENFKNVPVIMYNKNKCVRCGRCAKACTDGSLTLQEDGVRLKNHNGNLYKECVKQCLTGAITICGQNQNTDYVLKELLKDKTFYENTDGGVTFSGGEATMYTDFLVDICGQLKEEGIHTTLETSGYCSLEDMQQLSECIDLFLYDYKVHTAEKHLEWTGVDNKIIQKNLEYLSAVNARVILRIPLIPGVNDNQEFEQIMQYLATVPNITEINILPFHQMGSDKYALSGQLYSMGDYKECSMEEAKKHKLMAERYGFKVNIGGADIR